MNASARAGGDDGVLQALFKPRVYFYAKREPCA